MCSNELDGISKPKDIDKTEKIDKQDVQDTQDKQDKQDMQDIQDMYKIGLETIRKNWSKYKKDYLDQQIILWEDLEKKFSIDSDNMYLKIFKKFIDGNPIYYPRPIDNKIHIIQINSSTLEIKGLDGFERKYIHQLCNKIGLHHESKPAKKHKKFLYIYKPNEWLWEFTEKNSFGESDTYYKNREIETEKKIKLMEERSKKIYCSNCENNAMETELFCSVYYSGIYCEDCINYMSDGNGGTLSDHKFEPL